MLSFTLQGQAPHGRRSSHILRRPRIDGSAGAQRADPSRHGRCLRVGKEFLALVDYKGSGLVVKLPQARVAQLVDDGVGQPFAPAGRVFKEWVSVPKPDRQRWLGLLREGIAFVA